MAHHMLSALVIAFLANCVFGKPTIDQVTPKLDDNEIGVEANALDLSSVFAKSTIDQVTPKPDDNEIGVEGNALELSSVLPKSTIDQVTPKADDNEIGVEANALELSSDDLAYRIQYAKEMMTYMNQSVDPCDDFYEYACGNWENVIEERQAQHKRSNLIDIFYTLANYVEELLDQPVDNGTLYAEELRLAQQFYNSCRHAELIPMKKSQTYLDAIKEIGGFPAVDETWKPDNFSWFNMSAHMSVYGAQGLTKEEVVPVYPFLPYFQLPELGFDLIAHSDNMASNTSRGYKLNEKRMHEYLTIYGVEEAKANQVIADIFEFWRAVFAVFDEFGEDIELCSTLSNATSPFAAWNNYFEIAWNGKKFELFEENNCPCDYFYQKLDKICNERKEAVANYLALKFLYHLDARLEQAKFQNDFCVISVQHSLPYLLDYFYYKNHFSAELRAEVDTIIKELRRSLREMLEQADWLDESTRAEAMQKESTIVSRVGSFEDPTLSDRLIREMKNLTFVDGNYEQNNLNLRKFMTYMKRFSGLNHEQLSNDTKPLELLVSMQVNAFYYNIDNSINVMAGILHPPAYHHAWPESLKFGTLGYLIGHEFTHGFDTVGANYDSVGEERYWWSKKSGQVFDERSNCYATHFSSYLVPEINRKINGNQTKDENIADSGGLREAFNAYQRRMKELAAGPKHQLEEQMPGLDLSPEQLFFLGFAQVWCAAYKEEHYWEELTNEHTMDKYRVLGAVTNLEEFAKVYECPLGSNMHPSASKCRVW